MILCRRVATSVAVIEWDSPAEACEAARLLYDRPCDDHCEGHHTLVVTVPGKLLVRSIHVPTPSFKQLLEECYPPRPIVIHYGKAIEEDPSRWPAPRSLNLPLPPRGRRPMNDPETRRRQDAAVASVPADRKPKHPATVAAEEHDEAARLRAEADKHDRLADSLADAALYDHG